jgi:2-polyprenyl-3-methyl-5-hydroxy-6-metoxy-1,4-benzoquinol methylase
MLGLKGFKVLGVDCSSEMIKQAEAYCHPPSNIRFATLQHAENIFEPGSWDAIVCSSVIEFVEDAGGLLRSFRDSLRPGGVVVISYANSESLWSWYVNRRRHLHPHLNVQHHVWNRSQARRTFQSAGFRVLTRPKTFESPFDKYGPLRILSSLGIFGTLSIIVLEKHRS